MERYAGMSPGEVMRVARSDLLPNITFVCEGAQPLDSLYGAIGGQAQRFLRALNKKLGYTDVYISRSRGGSGFESHGTRDTGSDILGEERKEYNRIIPIIRKEARDLCGRHKSGKTKLSPPRSISFNLKSMRYSASDPRLTTWGLYLSLNYKEGHYVTPMEIL